MEMGIGDWLRRGTLIALTALAVAACAAAAAQGKGRCGAHPWCDTSLSPDRRAMLLVQALTPAERIGLLAGDRAIGVIGRAGTHTGDADGVPRLDVPPFLQTDGPIGVRQGKATSMPSSISLAASFNRRLARSYGALVGDEAKLKGNDVVFGPTVNILPRPCGAVGSRATGRTPSSPRGWASSGSRGCRPRA